MQLGLSNSITTPEYCESAYATKYASFNGSDSKALCNDLGRLPGILAGGTGTIGDNVSFAMWVKATWSIPDSPADAVVNTIPIFMLGSDTDVHEAFRCYYMIEDGSATNKNDLVIEVRTTSPGNARQVDIARLNSNNSITGSDSGSHSDMWSSHNGDIETNADGFVHIAFTRGTGEWSIYWNGQAMTLLDNDSGSLNTSTSEYDSFSIGFWEYSNLFGQLGVRDFALWSSELSSSDVELLNNSGVMADYRTLINTSPLLYYPLQEDGNDVALNISSGTTNNFTLSNVTFTDI
jgi:hypothetical protein